MKESFISRLIKLAFKLLPSQNKWKLNGEALWQFIARKQQEEDTKPPRWLKKQYKFKKLKRDGLIYWQMTKKGTEPSEHLIYFHGGGYVYGMSTMHWEFLAAMIDGWPCTVIVPLYPRPPQYTVEDVRRVALQLYASFVEQVGAERLVVMGDSAGGAIALMLAQQIRLQRWTQPHHIVLICPALDLQFNNPAIDAVIPHDPMLAREGIVEIGIKYAGSYALTDPLVSPLFGEKLDLAPVTILAGTHDITYPDAKQYAQLALEQGADVRYFEYEEMLHIWPLFPTREGREAREKIIAQLKSH